METITPQAAPAPATGPQTDMEQFLGAQIARLQASQARVARKVAVAQEIARDATRMAEKLSRS